MAKIRGEVGIVEVFPNGWIESAVDARLAIEHPQDEGGNQIDSFPLWVHLFGIFNFDLSMVDRGHKVEITWGMECQRLKDKYPGKVLEAKEVYNRTKDITIRAGNPRCQDLERYLSKHYPFIFH